MVQLDLEDAIRLRMEMLLRNNPDLEIDSSVQEGDWALLTLNEGGRLVGFEFLETDDSWSRPDALLQVVSDADLQRGRIAVVFHAATRSFLQFFGTNGVCFACSIISDTPRKQTAESGALRAFGAAGSRVAGFLPRAGVFYEKSRRAGAFLAAL